MLDKSIRDIERERQGLQTQEKKLITEIKKTAKQGQMVCFCLSYVNLYLVYIRVMKCLVGLLCFLVFNELYKFD